MSPTQFKSRFIASLPATPPELELHLDAFSTFPASLVDQLNISDMDRSIIIGFALKDLLDPKSFCNRIKPAANASPKQGSSELHRIDETVIAALIAALVDPIEVFAEAYLLDR